VSRIEQVGASRNATAGQVTLAWVLAQGDDFVVIPGTKKVTHLKEDVAACSLTLTIEEVTAISKIAEEAEISGERYDLPNLANILVDSPTSPTF